MTAAKPPLTPQQIAARLRYNQRAALLDGVYLTHPKGGRAGVLMKWEYEIHAKALHRMGLADSPHAPQLLTPLGLQVLDYMQTQQQELEPA